jgi:hypothetical protein
MFSTSFHKCIVCHEHHTFIMTHCTSQFLWYRYVLINLIMCTWHLRPKYVFLSRHIFRGSNLYYIELFTLKLTYPFNRVSFLWYICIFPISPVPRLRLICFHEYPVYSVLDWKGNGVFGKDITSTLHHRYYLSFAGIPPSLKIGIILHSYFLVPMGEKVKRAHISLTKYPFLVIHAKGGESISPKQKDRTTTNFKKCLNEVFQFVLKIFFSIGILFLI